MIGIHEHTGQYIEGVAELEQRISFCLRTRLGSMPAPYRKFGSDLPKLVDRKINDETKLECYVAIANALAEPINGFTQQFKLIKSRIITAANMIELQLTGLLLIDGESITLKGVKLQ